MYLDAVAWETESPSLRISPWIRGAPNSGFDWLVWRMSLRIRGSMGGRRLGPLGVGFEQGNLLAQREVLQGERSVSLNCGNERPEECMKHA